MAVFASTTKVKGEPLTDFIGTTRLPLTEWEALKVRVIQGGKHIIDLRGRSSFQSPAYLSIEMIAAAMGGQPFRWPAGTYVSNGKFDHIMMAMETPYNKGAVFKSSFKGRINRCGVENMLIESEYTSDTDEDHGWVAIEFNKMEQSWVRNITSRYFGNGLVSLNSGTRYVTVKDCKCLDAKSIITGGRRYSYNMNQAQQCLVIDCEATEGRHDCVTGSKGVGPNAFVRVNIRNAHGDTGPHQRWNVGTLYDNINSDGPINIQDRSNWGTGHGWAGANQVLWNCTAKEVCVQNPWVSAKNYSIGTKGTKHAGDFKNPVRPDGVWVRANATVSPASLFEAQLELRKRTGRLYH